MVDLGFKTVQPSEVSIAEGEPKDATSKIASKGSPMSVVEKSLEPAEEVQAKRTSDQPDSTNNSTIVDPGPSVEFTLKGLSFFKGSVTENNPLGRIFLSVGGIVFDVTDKGFGFYGPGMSYHCFAGRAASRALTLGETEGPDLELGDDVEDFTEQQIKDLRVQVEFYSGK